MLAFCGVRGPPDVLNVYGLFQANGMPAGALVQAELQGVSRTLCLMRCQDQEATMVPIFVYALQCWRVIAADLMTASISSCVGAWLAGGGLEKGAFAQDGQAGIGQ